MGLVSDEVFCHAENQQPPNLFAERQLVAFAHLLKRRPKLHVHEDAGALGLHRRAPPLTSLSPSPYTTKKAANGVWPRSEVRLDFPLTALKMPAIAPERPTRSTAWLESAFLDTKAFH